MANEYVTQADVLTALAATGTTFLNTDIDRARTAASRAVDEACGRPFGFYSTTGATAVYTPGEAAANYQDYAYLGGYSPHLMLDIDDLTSLTSLKVDVDGDGTYETTWTNGTDFYLDPPNNPLFAKPYERVVIKPQSGKLFPQWDNAVQVIGNFGWTVTPPEVTQYALIFVVQLLLRSRQAPFGILMAGMEQGSAVRISRFDPDFNRLLGHLVKPTRLIA